MDGNLWCQEVDCPAGTSPYLLVYGDMLGNIKVLELLRVLPHAAIYKAERGEEIFFLKVANPGEANITYLRQESDVFKAFKDKGGHTAIPNWRQHGAVNGEKAYGKVTARGTLRYYLLLDFEDGVFLSDMLLDNPQPWHVHVGWFTLTLAEVIAHLHNQTKKLHLNLTPDNIYIRYNNLGVPQPFLLDLGVQQDIGQTPLTDEAERIRQFIQPAYRPPELIHTKQITQRTDVYQIALIMHEMLEGRPAHEQQMRQDEEIHTDIVQINARVTRQDLPDRPASKNNQKDPRARNLKTLIERNIQYAPENRFPAPAAIYEELKKIYGPVQDKTEFSFARLGERVAASFILFATAAVVVFTLVMLVIALTSA